MRMPSLAEMLKDAYDNGFTLTGEDFEWIMEAVEKAEKYDKIVHCPECKYYYAPVCTMYKWLPMTSRKGYCYHGIKGEYKGKKPPVLKKYTIDMSRFMNPPEDDNG